MSLSQLGRNAIPQATGNAWVELTLLTNQWGCTPGYEEQMAAPQKMSERDSHAAAAGDDFFGASIFTRIWVGAVGFPDQLPEGPQAIPHSSPLRPGLRRTAFGCAFRLERVGGATRRAAEDPGLPVFVTGCGMGIDDDRKRIAWIDGSLEAVARCVADGVNVLGCLYKRLLDDCYFSSGYAFRFSPVEVSRETFERRRGRAPVG